MKNPKATQHGVIRFRDVGDYLQREEKLAAVRAAGSVDGITAAGRWFSIVPNNHGDWLGQRDEGFSRFIAIGDKTGNDPAVFENFSLGVVTNRDPWARNPGRSALASNMSAMIAAYNNELARFEAAYPVADRRARSEAVDGFVDADPRRISWTRALKADLAKAKTFAFADTCLTLSLYRPFTLQWLYYSRNFNEMVYQMPRIFPIGNTGKENRVICVAAPGSISGFTALMTNLPPELCVAAMKGGTQCFPRWIYETPGKAPDGELALEETSSEKGVVRQKEAITDVGLAHFRTAYAGEAITKEDVFYYVYGMLHSTEYRTRFADNLTKQLPRIPVVNSATAFWVFVEAGRELADLHCDFDKVEPYPVTVVQGDLRLATIADPMKFYRVEKMRFAGKRPNLDRTTVIYNPNITIIGIPPEAYDYVVNGKPAVEWVMDRQGVKTDPASGIVWDGNAFANETVGDPAYPFKLFCCVITVSLRTMEIVRSLPPLDVVPNAAEREPNLGSAKAAADEELEAADAAE